MLNLLFHLGDDRYALASEQIVEVIPVVLLRPLPKAPEYVAGLFNYRGAVVPVIDLCRLIAGRPARSFLSTRLILVQYENHLLGLVAEAVTEAAQVEQEAFVDTGLQVDHAPYLGKVAVAGYEKGLLQAVRVEHLLTDDVAKMLFAEEGAP